MIIGEGAVDGTEEGSGCLKIDANDLVVVGGELLDASTPILTSHVAAHLQGAQSDS